MLIDLVKLKGTVRGLIRTIRSYKVLMWMDLHLTLGAKHILG
jgi:hypothetical protein